MPDYPGDKVAREAYHIMLHYGWWVEPGVPGSYGEGCWFVMERAKDSAGIQPYGAKSQNETLLPRGKGVQVYNHEAPWPTDPFKALIEAEEWFKKESK